MQPSLPTFGHPYQPYDIQLDFMNNLYQVIENGQVGIFESPTGTGKSLSLICGSLTWLRDHNRKALDEVNSTENDTKELDWLVKAENDARRKRLIQDREDMEQKLISIRRSQADKRDRLQKRASAKKARTEITSADTVPANDEEYLLDDYASDDEQILEKRSANSAFSSTTQALLDRLGKGIKSEEVEESQDETKIIFCSRTHSQLSQFVNELRRVRPPSSYDAKVSPDNANEVVEGVKHVPLGSRKNLCINPRVSKLSSANAINERCLELQKPGVAKEQKCEFLQMVKDDDQMSTFRDRTLAEIQDIEDINSLGRSMSICPYYASRSVINRSEILTLPYPLLLQKSARDALGVSIGGNVVIIDEAHNLMDAIADTMSISMSLHQLEIALDQVTAYIQRFKAKLKGSNRVYLAQIIRLLNSIIACLGTTLAPSASETIVTAGQLLSGKGVDQIKPHKLIQYLQTSKLAFKVEGYTMAQQDAVSLPSEQSRRGLLMLFQNFLVVLMNPANEGRFFVHREAKNIMLRYALLDATEHFRDIVQEAKAVILAGGTMSPMSDYADFLFSYLDRGRLQTYSFGHVVPPSNLFVKTVQFGSNMVEFDFTFEKRKTPSMMTELGRTLLRICESVPDGVVVFFPSYDYLSQVTNTWRKSTAGPSIWTSLSIWKEVFEESKSTQVEELLRQYTKSIDSGKGGLLLSVVGGKLSEGINFSDRLGRAVVAVGLPFPNPSGAEWKSKLQYVEETRYHKCRHDEKMDEQTARRMAQAASKDFYENVCMRAVNQSIGRVIRHRHDYAAIILLDRRFTTDRTKTKLPGWIQSSLTGNKIEKAADLERGLRSFFANKR